jgi:hypothetical protein
MGFVKFIYLRGEVQIALNFKKHNLYSPTHAAYNTTTKLVPTFLGSTMDPNSIGLYSCRSLRHYYLFTIIYKLSTASEKCKMKAGPLIS